MKIKMNRPRRPSLWPGLVLLPALLLAGCTSAPKKQPVLYFPPAPDEPRIQFLTGFGMESDLKSRGGFADFVMGQERVVRPILKPYGISARRGMLHIADTQSKSVVFVNLNDGGSFRYLRPPAPASLKLPLSAVEDVEGNCYVSDSVRGQVLICDKDGNAIGEIGRAGEMKPAGLALVGDKLYVCDIQAHRVAVFDRKTRVQLAVYPRDPNEEKGKLYSPTNVAVDKDGRVIVADTGGYVVQVYAPDGSHVRTIGDQGLKPGRFAMPKGVGVDREGRIYVVDAATAVVQMFDADGQLLMYFGLPENSGVAGLYLPAGLCIDYDNVPFFEKHAAPGQKIEFLIYVVNQAGRQKVGVYGFLKRK